MFDDLKGLFKNVLGIAVLVALGKAYMLYQVPKTENLGIVLAGIAAVVGVVLIRQLPSVSWSSLSGGGAGLADPDEVKNLKEDWGQELDLSRLTDDALGKVLKKLKDDELSQETLNQLCGLREERREIRRALENLIKSLKPDE